MDQLARLPSYEKYIEPLLRYLANQIGPVLARDAHEGVADLVGLTPEARTLMLPSGSQLAYKNRIGWAHDRLKRAGFSSSPRRGVWQITDSGRAYIAAHPTPLTDDDLRHLAIETKDVRLRTSDALEATGDLDLPSLKLTQSPDDQLESALVEIRDSVAAELLETLRSVSPTFFESIVLDVLHRMGYGATRDDVRRVGGSGDAGIDGVISLDRLGLEKVYVQAKRWQEQIGRPIVQGFYGAVRGQHATKGILITTSTFSDHAQHYVNSVEGIVLIDGQRLAHLMIDYGVGVSSREIKVPRIDSDYFDA